MKNLIKNLDSVAKNIDIVKISFMKLINSGFAFLHSLINMYINGKRCPKIKFN